MRERERGSGGGGESRLWLFFPRSLAPNALTKFFTLCILSFKYFADRGFRWRFACQSFASAGVRRASISAC